MYCSKTLTGVLHKYPAYHFDCGMICVVQHNTKTCIICTGVVWLALPAAIRVNYHLTLIAPSLECFMLNGVLVSLLH